MSDLRPHPVGVVIGEQTYKLSFNLRAIDEIQAACNLGLFDAIKHVAAAADGVTDRDTLRVFKQVFCALTGTDEDAAGEMIDLSNFQSIAWRIMEAYGISVPEPDEDEDEDEDADPKAQTGR